MKSHFRIGASCFLVFRSQPLRSLIGALALSLITTGAAFGGSITASWQKDSRVGTDTYTYKDPGAGQINVSGGMPGTLTITESPVLGNNTSFEIWNGTILPARGVARAKSLIALSGDSWQQKLVQTKPVGPLTAAVSALGSGNWQSVFRPGGFLTPSYIDVGYFATTDIGPFTPPPAPIALVPYYIYSEVKDPITIRVNPNDPPGSITMQDTIPAGYIDLSGIAMSPTASDGFVGSFYSNLTLNEDDVYRLIITVRPTNDPATQVQVKYFNSDGVEDVGEEAEISSHLQFDAKNIVLTVASTIVLPQYAITDPPPGDYAVGGEITAGLGLPPSQ